MPRGVYIRTPEAKANISAARKLNSGPNKGQPMKAEQKEKIRTAFMGRGRTLYGRGRQPSPTMIIFGQVLCPAGYLMDTVTVTAPNPNNRSGVKTYVLDFALESEKVNIEIDGRTHLGREAKDRERDEHLRSLGWKVIRIKV